ncbi:MAG: hypothetical protein H7061_08780 [Bdellovibrionaceae bacterium]|nr:hypothetical protein [Bdellovibrio sp.]
MKWGPFLILLVIFFSASQSTWAAPRHNVSVSSVDLIPETFEQAPSEQPEIFDSNLGSPVMTNAAEVRVPSRLVIPISTTVKMMPNHMIEKASSIINNAEKVMVAEGKKLGTACNHYVGRVLEVSGFIKKGFLANDFDGYAKKYISHYRAVDFDRTQSAASAARLQDYIWSFPERTPFILQWSRGKSFGHIALMERVGDQLIIYQASLHKHTARKNLTTVKTLLTGYNRRTLTVYTELTP